MTTKGHRTLEQLLFVLGVWGFILAVLYSAYGIWRFFSFIRG